MCGLFSAIFRATTHATSNISNIKNNRRNKEHSNVINEFIGSKIASMSLTFKQYYTYINIDNTCERKI